MLEVGQVDDKCTKFTCLGCRVKFESVELQRSHFKSDWHTYNLKRKVCQLEPINLESFDAIQATNIEQQRLLNKRRSKRKAEIPIKVPSSSEDECDDDDDDDWEQIDNDSDAEYNDEEIEEMLARKIRSDTCLFCDKKSNGIKNNVDHMNLWHGFFIPEEQYLIDLEGLLDYLGLKIGAGATCIWCNKQFTSVQGVRLHMQSKNHCKILYDQSKAVEEFKEYYDYSGQVTLPMKPLSELAIPKKKSSERHHQHQKALVAAQKTSSSSSRSLVAARSGLPTSQQANSLKKFESKRAKTLLKVWMSNNNTMRGRIRQQNPI